MTNVVRKPNGCLKITIYCKVAHVDQCFNVTSDPTLKHKLSVVSTLHHRARTVISETGDRALGVAHVNCALRQYEYEFPDWLIERGTAPPKETDSTQERETGSGKDTSRKGLPYIKGLSKELRKTLRAHRVNSFFKLSSMLFQLLCSPKDPSKKEEASRVIYQINFEGVGRIVAVGVPTLGNLAGH